MCVCVSKFIEIYLHYREIGRVISNIKMLVILNTLVKKLVLYMRHYKWTCTNYYFICDTISLAFKIFFLSQIIYPT